MTSVYVISSPSDSNKSKVGIAGDLSARLQQYQTYSADRDFRVYWSVELPTRDEALRLESRILAAGRDAGWGARGEWLLMCPSIVTALAEDVAHH